MAVARETGCRLLVYTTEDDRVGHHSLAEALLERARQDGLRGATVWRGIEGFGRSGALRTTRLPDVNRGLPLVVEIIDHPDRVTAFLPVVSELAPRAVATIEPVEIGRPAADQGPPPDRTPATP